MTIRWWLASIRKTPFAGRFGRAFVLLRSPAGQGVTRNRSNASSFDLETRLPDIRQQTDLPKVGPFVKIGHPVFGQISGLSWHYQYHLPNVPKKCVDEHGRFWTMDDDRGPRLSDPGVLKICGNDRRLGSLETLKMFDSLDLLEIKKPEFLRQLLWTRIVGKRGEFVTRKVRVFQQQKRRF